MATADAGGMHRVKREDAYSLGEYNKVTYVAPNSMVAFTGSLAGAAVLIENATNVTLNLNNGGSMTGALLNTKEIHPIGVNKVTIGATGKVHVLHK